MKRFTTFLALAAVLAIAGPANALAPPDSPDECLLSLDELPVTMQVTLARSIDADAPALAAHDAAPVALEPAESSLPWCPTSSREPVPLAARWPDVLPMRPQVSPTMQRRPPSVSLTSVSVRRGDPSLTRLVKRVHGRSRLV